MQPCLGGLLLFRDSSCPCGPCPTIPAAMSVPAAAPLLHTPRCLVWSFSCLSLSLSYLPFRVEPFEGNGEVPCLPDSLPTYLHKNDKEMTLYLPFVLVHSTQRYYDIPWHYGFTAVFWGYRSISGLLQILKSWCHTWQGGEGPHDKICYLTLRSE